MSELDVRCGYCDHVIAADEPICFYATNRDHQDLEPYCEPCWRDDLQQRNAFDVLATWPVTGCEICERAIRGPRAKVCSHECKSRLPAARRARRRKELQASVTPDSFTCTRCGEQIVGTVVFWWNDHWGHRRAHDQTWCEHCWAAMRTDEDRETWKRTDGEPNLLGIVPPNPDAEGYDPFARIGDFEPEPCGHCGRAIRWGHPSGFCCERCDYEDEKASRRVTPTEKTCEHCGESFTPKRSDAKTCSDRCRQALRRSRLSAVNENRGGRKSQTAVTDSERARP